MSKQAIIELQDSNAAKYRKAHSSKAKGELLKQLVELTGYKSTKNIIRFYSRVRNLIALRESLDPIELEENIQKSLKRLFLLMKPESIL
ncbi:MAG: hypothetical protein IJB31_00615 [Akkermansia sp.]|nr:hypothetical protein [Akkermansia sp.]